MNKSSKVQAILDEYELDHIDKSILQHIMTKAGITDAKIGTLIGMGRRQVNLRRNHEKFKNALKELQREPLEIIRGTLKRAAQVLAKSLNSTNEKLAVESACKILYSEGILKKESDTSVHIGPNVIQINKRNGDAVVYETQFIENKPK